MSWSEIDSEMRLAGIFRLRIVARATGKPGVEISFIRHPQEQSARPARTRARAGALLVRHRPAGTLPAHDSSVAVS